MNEQVFKYMHVCTVIQIFVYMHALLYVYERMYVFI